MKEEDKKLPQVANTASGAQLSLNTRLQPSYTSAWQTQLNDTMSKIMNREKFTYDLNGDALWNQYKDQYVTGGKMAMMDTMGQAAALTGGYGNSYAQGVGQQAYQGYLQGLNDKIPELYQLALDSYNREGDALMQQYGMLADREATDYSRYTDQRDYDYMVQQDARAQKNKDKEDARAMAMAMLEAGTMPSEEMLAAAGLSNEVVTALYPNLATGAGGAAGSNTGLNVDTTSDWYSNAVENEGWLTSSDGQNWLGSEQGQNWLLYTVIPTSVESVGFTDEYGYTTTLDDVVTKLESWGVPQNIIDEVERQSNAK